MTKRNSQISRENVGSRPEAKAFSPTNFLTASQNVSVVLEPNSNKIPSPFVFRCAIFWLRHITGFTEEFCKGLAFPGLISRASHLISFTFPAFYQVLHPSCPSSFLAAGFLISRRVVAYCFSFPTAFETWRVFE